MAAQWRLTAAQTDYLRSRYLRPNPRLGLREALLRHARASMDISDGLMKDLGRMCRASGVGAWVGSAALPLSDAFKAVRDADPLAAQNSLFAGDDYEILTSVPSERVAQFKVEALIAGIEVTDIGMFTVSQTVHLKDSGGDDIDVIASGWDHF